MGRKGGNMALVGVRKRKEKKGDNDVVIFLIQVFKWIKKIKKNVCMIHSSKVNLSVQLHIKANYQQI